MASQVIMPQLGLTMTEGTVSKWLKNVGDLVKAGDLLVEVSTDKITNQIESAVSGTLLDIVVPAGSVVPVKAVLAYVGQQGEDVPRERESNTAATAATVSEAPAIMTVSHRQSDGNRGRVKASPLAKRMALEKEISLSLVTGTGPDGRVVAKDVLAFSVSSPRKPAISPLAAKMAAAEGVDPAQLAKSGRIMSSDILAGPQATLAQPDSGGAAIPLAGMRRVIAERLGKSWRDAPHVHMTAEVDMTAAMALKERLYAQLGKKISFTAYVVKACTMTLLEFPDFSTYITDGQIYSSPTINIGVAVAVDRGLVVPVIRDAGGKSLLGLQQAIDELSSRARTGELSPDSMTGGTFTVSNLGMYDVDHFTPVINPPESAIIGVCRIAKKTIVCGDAIVVRPIINVVMSFDHRLIDGALAARFMQRLRQYMEEPLLMI